MTARKRPRRDYLIENLRGMCAYQGHAQEYPCGQTVRTLAEYCTACLAAERITPPQNSVTSQVLREIAERILLRCPDSNRQTCQCQRDADDLCRIAKDGT